MNEKGEKQIDTREEKGYFCVIENDPGAVRFVVWRRCD